MRSITIGLAVLFVLAACSGGEDSPAARRSATRWADMVCTDLGNWIDAAAAAPAPAAAAAALRLRAGIARVDPPDTDDGLAAQGEMEKLATAVERRARDADRGAIAEIIAEARDAVDRIRGLTPGGAVESALEGAEPCRALRG